MIAHEIDAVVFDVLGTMVDEPGGIRRGIAGVVSPALARPADPQVLLERWQAHVEEQQRRILVGARAYASTDIVDMEAAQRVAAEAGTTTPGTATALVGAAQQLDPWPDSVSALDRIATRFPVIGLSNASRRALTRINAHARLRWHQALSAEDVRAYKPQPEVYQLAITTLGFPPERLLMVAAHAWDLRGAQAAGMRTAYVERPVGDPPASGDVFDLHAASLGELAERLGV